MEARSLEDQKNRIRRVTSEIDHDLEIEFYKNRVNPETTGIRFKVKDTNTGKIYGSIRVDCEWALTEVVDMNDSALRQRIQALIGR